MKPTLDWKIKNFASIRSNIKSALLSCLLWNAVYFGPITFDFKKHAAGGYALITGGAGGIGKSTAHQMAQRGIDRVRTMKVE